MGDLTVKQEPLSETKVEVEPVSIPIPWPRSSSEYDGSDSKAAVPIASGSSVRLYKVTINWLFI